MSRVLVCLLALAALPGFVLGSPTPADPFLYFNVYSLGNIGSGASPYHSDYQGIGGCAGSAWFSSMSLNDVGLVPSDWAFHAAGDFTMTGDVNNGGIEATGDVALTSFSVDGGVTSGGDVTGTGGTIDGDLIAAGAVALSGVTVTGSTLDYTAFSAACDHGSVSDFLTARSAYYAALPVTGSTIVGGQVVFNAVSGTNVFSVDATAIVAAWGVAIQGPPDATIIVNVAGATAAFESMAWTVAPSVDPCRVLINVPSANTLTIQGINLIGNVLAPHAATSFPSGLVTGALWIGDLQGGGQVNDGGGFCEPEQPTSVKTTSWGSVKSMFR